MSDIEINKTKVLKSVAWKVMERVTVQGVQFIVQIILARLLVPEQFGMIAIVMVFINLAQVFVQSGFNTALIQKKDAGEEEFSSVFYLSLGVAGMLYIVIFALAPYLAIFYNMSELTYLLRVLSLTLFLGATISVQVAYITKYLLFEKLFKCSLFSTFISGIVGVIAAYKGLGVWALVIQQLLNQTLITIAMWFTVEWRPKLMFSLSKVKKLFEFSSKLLVSALFDAVYRELRTLLVGRIYEPKILGYYNRGDQFPQLIATNIDGSIQAVMFPTLAAHQDDKKRMKEMMRRAIVSSSFFIFPMMIGMAVVAEPLVKIVLTDKWLPAVPFLQISCFTYALWPIHTANLQAINAIGRSDVYLKLEIVKKIIGITVLVISISYGIYAIALGGAAIGVIATFINAYPNKQLLDYSYSEQLTDIMPALLISILMGGIVYLFNLLRISAGQILILQVVSGCIVYAGLAKIFKLESFIYLVSTMKELIKFKSHVKR